MTSKIILIHNDVICYQRHDGVSLNKDKGIIFPG
nr:MAG TPA_asm: hypothetical protein [Caudoviricetes sp.]